MFVSSVYIALGLLILLTPFLIPVRLKNRKAKRIKTVLSICLIVVTLNAITPNKAVQGAPFVLMGEDSRAKMSCDYKVMITAKFCSDGVSPERCHCENPNALATIAHCYKVAYEHQIDAFLKTCKRDYNLEISRKVFEDIHDNYTKYSKSLNDDYNFSYIVDHPVKVDDSELMVLKRSYDQFLGNYERSVYYGMYLLSFWLIVFILAGLGNWSKILYPNLQKRMTGKCTNWIRSKVTLPAAGGMLKTHEKVVAKYVEMLVPTRAEVLILVAFSVLCAYFTQYRIQYQEGDPLFHEKNNALFRYIAVRASILLSHLMPLMILFGGRNNFLQWITRWDYSTFITFHRWLSRIIMILLTIHVVCYILYIQQFAKKIVEPYMIWGAIATISGALIMVQGLLVLRRRWYELFLLLHIILAFAFILGAYIHVYDLKWLWFYYITGAIWGFDRIVRVGRLMSFGFPKAEVLLLADETLKVVIPIPENWEVIPGGHVFIHFLRPSCFWQSHPFTYTTDISLDSHIILYIKVKQGVTSSLYQYLLDHPGRSTHIRVAIEGSYGESTPAAKYESSVFVAGGNGIPGIYDEAYQLAKKLEHSNQKIKLIWITREYKSLYWFYEELLSLADTKIQTEIYVTRPDSYSCLEEFERRVPSHGDSEEVSSSSKQYVDENTPLMSMAHELNYVDPNDKSKKEETISKIKSELSHICIKEGRPTITNIVRDCIKESTGATCFVSCGHPIMVDNLRASVVSNITNDEHKRVDYFEQLQVWA